MLLFKSFDKFRGNNRGYYTLEELNQETKKKFDIEFIDEKLFKMGKTNKIGKGLISSFFSFLNLKNQYFLLFKIH